MRRIYYIIIIFISLIVLYFNTIFILNTGISMEYEVDHPRIMFGNNENIEKRERELKMYYYLSIAVYIACFAGIGGSIYRLVNPKKKADS